MEEQTSTVAAEETGLLYITSQLSSKGWDLPKRLSPGTFPRPMPWRCFYRFQQFNSD